MDEKNTAQFAPASPSDTLIGSPARRLESADGSKGHASKASLPSNQGGAAKPPFESQGTLTNESEEAPGRPFAQKKGLRFWLILLSLMVVIALSGE